MATLVNGSWRGALGIGGANGIVRAIALRGNDVFIGGQFEVVGRALALSLARFDGAMWQEVGAASNGTVDALCFDPNGVLYVGGRFDQIGGIAAMGFAAWDGSTWSVPGGGIPFDVSSIAADPAGNIYVSGVNRIASLSPHRVMRWDGNAWTPLGSWLGEIACLTYDVALGVLYAGGTFTMVDSVAANSVARWDGSSWAPLGNGVDGEVLALAPDAGGVLYAGGAFMSSGGKPMNYIGKWNPSTGQWSDLGHGPNNVVKALVLKNGFLHVGGDFNYVGTWPGGSPANGYAVCRPRFKTWSPMGAFDANSVQSLALHPNGAIYAGGSFDTVQGVVAHRIAKWDGSAWNALGTSDSVNDAVYALASDRAGNTYLTGDFGWAGTQRTNFAARWTGSTWEAFDVAAPTGQGLGRAIAIDALGRPYVGGRPSGALYSLALVYRFSSSGTTVVMDTVGDGLNGDIKVLAFDPTGTLHVGGYFPNATKSLSDYATNHLARWDGTKYVPVGGGVDNCVQTITFDSHAKLYAGGWFMQAGGVAVSRIACWDGSVWSSLNGGVDGPVFALAVGPNNELYAGGAFTLAGGTAASNIARWDGAQWTPLGTGVNGSVQAILVDDAGIVVACGRFTTAGGVPVQHIAQWNGSNWQPLGGGINGLPLAVALDSAGNLVVGGIFSQANGQDSCFFAFYTAIPVTVSTNPPGAGPPIPPGPPPTEPGLYPDWWIKIITTAVGLVAKLAIRAAAKWK